jgi:pimeloyl-ACP methyl ester carboxylesterase
MKNFLLIGLIFCLCAVSLFIWSSYRIDSREVYTGQELATEGRFVKVGDVNAHYIRKGKGEPLLLIHGIFSSVFVWHKNIDELSRYFDVIAVDLKGYGYSDKPADGRYSKEDIRQFMIDFMDAINVEKAILAGHSWGGGIAMDLALTCPQRVEKLVLIDSIGYTLKHNFLSWLLKLPGMGKFLLALCDKDTLEWILKKGVFFDPSLVTTEEIEGWIRPYYVKGAVQAALELRNFDFVIGEQIKDISCPAMIIWGQDDKCLPVKFAERFKQDIKRSALNIIPDCGHNPQEEKPKEVNELIRKFVLE